ncbi:hypothetical protein Pme01_34400 [Planosporangium mesophilum]|uniref:Uncharacterized protein n=1 Tax=Planosporangium mesophilum TaxID=689768 RepID=A0A8J3TBW1_9ACTN|nr:hypothetical protein Pme01_34400 [Planosporangium mesophilum]
MVFVYFLQFYLDHRHAFQHPAPDVIPSASTVGDVPAGALTRATARPAGAAALPQAHRIGIR